MTIKELTRKAGRARMASLSPDERQELARLGGLALSSRMSPASRKQAASHAAKARWKSVKRVKSADVPANTLAGSTVNDNA